MTSVMETEKLGFVAEVGPEVEVRRAVDATEAEHNSLCVASSLDDCLQVFCAEVDASEVNLFCCPSRCLRERVHVELRLYSGVAVCKIVDYEQFESCGSEVVEKASEVCVCV